MDCASFDITGISGKRIAVLSTGGTIEMLPGRRGLQLADDHNPLPIYGSSIPSGIEIEHVRFSNIPSPWMTPGMMVSLCSRIDELAQSGAYSGIVVTHGTDTLEETAFLADICPDRNVPVVFTAAMRSQAELGVDGPRNVRGAVLVASTDEVHKLGVTVVLNDEIHAAGRVTKTYTSNVSSFASPGYGPLGFVDQDSVLLQRKPLWRIQLPSGKLDIKSGVGLVKIAAGLGAREIMHCIESGYEAVVVEALGRGNVPPAVSEAIGLALKNDIIVCITSRCYVGRVLGVYDYEGGGARLEEMGALMAGDMQGHKLRLLLMAALGRNMQPEEIAAILSRL
ncbi:MAG: asparaginase [Candidatus Aegiribacteria sp.]|nr:asparaginase [Candidatus Aegiribacteria sp.]MBD3294651.1 asparaginase [Candidatus Fermentibacteria bacterium]